MHMQFHEQAFVDELATLVSFRSISSDPDFADDVRQCAGYLEDRLRNLGAATRLLETGRHPLLVARIEQSPDYPTVTLYNHYDVQPIAQPECWTSDPFTLRVDGDRYIARGATDDKGNLLVGLHAVQLALEHELKLNLELIYEGEEEIGSLNFATAIDRARDFLRPDCIAVLDGAWTSRERPSIQYGCRGLLYMHWDLKTGEIPVHSGILGGAARNPLIELMAAAAKCYDVTTNTILVPGIERGIREPPDDEIAVWMEAEPDAEQLKATYQLRSLRSTDHRRLVLDLLARPTFEVHGCVGGYMKRDGKMTVIPGNAQLLVSMRLAPDQDPDHVFDCVHQFVERINPDIEVRNIAGARPYSGDPDSAPLQAARCAVQEAFGHPVAVTRAAATIGAVPLLYESLGRVPIFLLAFSLSEHNMHSPNECFDRQQAEGGVRALAAFFQKMAGQETRGRQQQI